MPFVRQPKLRSIQGEKVQYHLLSCFPLPVTQPNISFASFGLIQGTIRPLWKSLAKIWATDLNTDCLAVTQSTEKHLLSKWALQAASHFRGAVQVSKAKLLGPGVIPMQPFPAPICLPELVQVHPTQHHKTHCKHILIAYLWWLSSDAFFFFPRDRTNNYINITWILLMEEYSIPLGSGVVFKKQTSCGYLRVHCLHANLGGNEEHQCTTALGRFKWLISLPTAFHKPQKTFRFWWRCTSLTLMTAELIF